MAPARLLQRNVRVAARMQEQYVDEEEEEAGDEDEAGLGTEEEDEDLDGSELDDEEDDSGAEGPSDIEDGNQLEDGDVQQRISSVSFGVLKKAQDVLSQKRKRGSDEAPEQDHKLETLRKRLRQIKDEKTTISSSQRQTERLQDQGSDDQDSDNDSAPSEEGAATTGRSSKHAPAEQTSRHQVTRKRNVIEVPKRNIRDPRFDAFNHTDSTQQAHTERAYSFLDDYQKSEIIELKSALKRTKDEADYTTLRRKINSMENKLKSKAAREREQEVVRQHRREEKGKVQAGKTPYYLKEKEIKERALVEKFRGMKGREREKTIEKKRLKESQKEKRRMPRERRVDG
ncbi:hypothetical protein LTR62_008725 [Meristemomyces frigidus]|uniref:rRNA biogenesis protein RRP36 n=1 Tax=Meristemomyces frigidus TaxID=1508187 RepID=A0AAN7TDA6_9PEZI|nr:hypothetical protein LTR62_008725 [Meristemomyces frigidus]